MNLYARELLAHLQRRRAELKVLERERERTYAFWSISKYFGQSQDWWTDFIHEQWIPWEELKVIKRPEGDVQRDVSREYVLGVWESRRDCLDEIAVCEADIERTLKALLDSGVEMSRMVEAYGASLSGIYNFCRKFEWFVPKKNKKTLDTISDVE